jgi:hypothetical protein
MRRQAVSTTAAPLYKALDACAFAKTFSEGGRKDA